MMTEEETYQQAITIFQKLTTQNRGDIFSLKQLSKLYARTAKTEEVMNCYQSILEEDPEDIWTLKRLGEKYFNEKQFAKAYDIYKKWSDADPFDGEAQIKVIDTFREKTAVEDPENKGKLFFNEIKRAREAMEKTNDSFSSFYCGYSYLTLTADYNPNEEEQQNAIECFKRAISQDSQNLWCYWGLRYVYSRISLSSDNRALHNEGIKICKKALDIDPDSPRAHYELGEAFNENTEMNTKNEAVKEYRATLALDPEFTEAYFKLGHIFRMKRMYEKAVEYLQMVLDQDPAGNLARDAMRSLVFIEKNREGATG